MKPLPTELWLHIADFLSPNDLLKVIGVNRLFFNLIMNELYGQLSFITPDPHVLSEKLTMLSTDPCMCQRVRKLTIWPSAVRDAIKVIEHEKKPSNHEVQRPQTPRPQAYLNKIGGIFSHRRSHSRAPTPPKGHEALLPPAQRLDMFLNVINHLQNVDSLEINWYLDHGSAASAWRVPFFPEIWQSLGQNLHCLTIDMQVFKLNDVVKSCGNMPRIEELDLTLRCDATHRHPGDTTVPYFVNKFSATLRALSIKTIGHQQLSTNFQLLGQFPRLRKLSLIMPLDSQHLNDPSGLKQLLHNHAEIEHLCIRYSRCCKDCSNDGFLSYDGTHDIFSAINLPALRSLELGLHIPIPQAAAIKYTMLDAISRMANDLITLTLVDRSLTLEEIKLILSLFPSYRLRKLSLFAQLLSPQLIDVIARNCPNLNSLSLDIQRVVKSEIGGVDNIEDDVDGFADALVEHAIDLDNDSWRYRTWTLADISVMKWQFKVGHTYNWPTMEAMAYVIPTVRSFAGMDHMEKNQYLLKAEAPRRPVDRGNRLKPFDT